MLFELLEPADSDTALPMREATVTAAPVAASTMVEAETDATLRLLRACVEAMGLLQEKVDSIEARLGDGVDHGSRDQDGLRAEMASLQTAIVTGAGRVTDAETRLARLEAGAQDFAARHADDVAAARAEAANWRMRVETDSMAFEQLSARLGVIEHGLTEKLEVATQTVADRDAALVERAAENARLQAETRLVESASERLRVRLVSVDATIADQRARIVCLQNKLATATYAIRFEHMSRAMEASDTPSRDILDLAGMASESLISAA